MRDRPVVTITGADVRSNGILVGKCLRPPGKLPVIGADSYDDARVKAAEALRGGEGR